jgi:hypothetical protein
LLGETQTHYIEFLQKANRLPLDGTRSYAEQTISCLSGYGDGWRSACLAWRSGCTGWCAQGTGCSSRPLGMLLSAALVAGIAGA